MIWVDYKIRFIKQISSQINKLTVSTNKSFSVYASAPATNGLSTISHDYLKGSYALDLEAVKQGACSLPHLNKTLVTSCKRLNG